MLMLPSGTEQITFLMCHFPLWPQTLQKAQDKMSKRANLTKTKLPEFWWVKYSSIVFPDTDNSSCCLICILEQQTAAQTTDNDPFLPE